VYFIIFPKLPKEGEKMTKKHFALSMIVPLFIATNIEAGETNSSLANISGDIRGGYQYGDVGGDSEDEFGLSASIKYESSAWNNLKFGARASAVTGNGKEADVDIFMPFFDRKNNGYAILNELYLNGSFGNSELTIGRQELDLPFVDSDDDYWGLVPDRYEAVLFTNKDIKDTIITLAHIRSWSGVDSPEPKRFNRINKNDGMQIAGIEYSGIKNTTLKGFAYHAKDFVDMGYLEANFENETDLFKYSATAQYALQDYDNGSKANIFGAAIEVEPNGSGLTLNVAYNKNTKNGIADVFYGAGPFVTSMEHYTLAELEGKGSMIKGGLSYDAKSILAGLYFEANYAKLYRDAIGDADGIDYKIGYDYSDNLGFKIVYTNFDDYLNDDMKNLRVYAMYKF
jgi:hypothetical protein